jgi:hypothetical protein
MDIMYIHFRCGIIIKGIIKGVNIMHAHEGHVQGQRIELSPEEFDQIIRGEIIIVPLGEDNPSDPSNSIQPAVRTIEYDPFAENPVMVVLPNGHINFVGSLACAIENVKAGRPAENDYGVPHDVAIHNQVITATRAAERKRSLSTQEAQVMQM